MFAWHRGPSNPGHLYIAAASAGVVSEFRDILEGNLPTVSWFNPPVIASDHPQGDTNLSPECNALLVDALMASNSWNDTALFITWDDAGGCTITLRPASSIVAAKGSACRLEIGRARVRLVCRTRIRQHLPIRRRRFQSLDARCTRRDLRRLERCVRFQRRGCVLASDRSAARCIAFTARRERAQRPVASRVPARGARARAHDRERRAALALPASRPRSRAARRRRRADVGVDGDGATDALKRPIRLRGAR